MNTTNGGDTFSHITRATIINRSLLQSSLNKAQQIGGADTARTLETIARFVEQSGNAEAGEHLDLFNEEIQKAQPRRSILRNAWDGLVKALPAVTSIAGAAEAIAKLCG